VQGYAALEAFQGSTRAFNSSKPARPYICRLIALSRLICPSIGPLLHGVVIGHIANWLEVLENAKPYVVQAAS
jgi:hypothetical protein